MQNSLDVVGSDDFAIEYRDTRFAELDAQIQAAKADRQQRPAAPKHKRQRTGPALPREVRKEITRCARQLRQHPTLFSADPKLKDRASRFLRSLLPPQRRRGRPGIASVSKAILLLKRFKRQHLDFDYRVALEMEKNAKLEGRAYGNIPARPISGLELEHELSLLSKKFVKKDLFYGTANLFDWSFTTNQKKIIFYVLSLMSRAWLRRTRRMRASYADLF
jgi:hypothetical protein